MNGLIAGFLEIEPLRHVTIAELPAHSMQIESAEWLGILCIAGMAAILVIPSGIIWILEKKKIIPTSKTIHFRQCRNTVIKPAPLDKNQGRHSRRPL